MKILFICLGNICRSPMAKFIMQDLIDKQNTKLNITIDSAATSDEEEGNDMYYAAKKILDKNSVSYFTHKSRKMTKQDYEKYDYIIGMDKQNIDDIIRIVGSDEENKVHRLLDLTGDNKDIEDPWYTRNFPKVYDEILKGCNAILEIILKNT